MSKRLTGHVHAHGCAACHGRYEDACPTPETDARCIVCRGGRAWELLRQNALPKDCCLQARLVTKAEKTTYRLAGTHLWFICLDCKRTHPFKPKRGLDRT